MTGGSEKGTEMARDERLTSAGGTAGRAERPVFDISAASQARMYDYLLGGYFL